MSLRLRLTIVYFVLAAAALGSFALVVSVIASGRIYQSLDTSMTSRADALTQELETSSPPLAQADMEQLRRALGPESSVGSVIELRDLNGGVLYSSIPRSSNSLPVLSTEPTAGGSFSTHKVQGRRLRVLSQPIVMNGSPVAVLDLGQSLAETDEALNEIRFVSIIGGLLVLGVTSASAYFLAGRALRPVHHAAVLAREIERTADFSRRLPAPQTLDEVGALTSTLNAMIARVEAMLLTQRAFLADSSHELRRPLTVLRANIDVMKNPALSPNERAACLQEMSVEAGAMSRLLSDLLLLSREAPQSMDRAPVDYSRLCEDVLARLRNHDGDHKLLADVAPSIEVMGDRERLSQMLWNVLENATQYTAADGRIEFRLLRENGHARVEVQDTGVGVSEQDRARIFERFYRGEAARALRGDGVGLGLAIVKYVAEAHGGAVEITSRPGDGSCVVLELPALT